MRDKRQKFIDLGEKRVIKAINAIRLVGNLSNKNNYEYTEADARKIAKALEDELRDLKRRFDDAGTGREANFKLR